MKPLLATLAFLFLCSSSFAYTHYHYVNLEWGDKWNSANREEWAFGFVFSNLSYQGSYNDYVNDKVTNTKVNFQVPMTGYNYSVGYCYPLNTMNGNSSLNISGGSLVFMASTGSINKQYTASDAIDKISYFYCGLPVMLEYRSGADAFYDKKFNHTFGFGAGVCPSFSLVDISRIETSSSYSTENDGDMQLMLTPMLKAEAGFRFGIVMKLRLTCMFYTNLGKAEGEDWTIYNNPDKGNTRPSPQKLTYKGTVKQTAPLLLSLTLYPFSFLWEKDKYLN